MAFVSSQIPEEQQNQFAPQGQTTANPLALLPPQAAQTGGSVGQAGGTSPTSGSSTQFGSGASRLGDYLKANQDQVQQMAQGIAGNLNNQYGQQQGAVNDLGTQFGQQVQQGYAAPDVQLVDRAVANPSAFTQDTGNVKAFQSQLNDQYTGPGNLEGTQPYANTQKNIQDAINTSGSVNTYPGLATYLQNNVQGTYMPGMNTLDTTLLYGDTPAYGQVTAAAGQFGQLPGQLAKTAQGADQAVQAAQAAAPVAAQYAQNALGGAAANENQALQDQLNSAQGAFGVYNTDVGQLRGAAQDINTQIQQYLAANPNVTVSGNTDFLSPWTNLAEDTANPTLESVANPQDFANMQALQTLSGGTVPINTPLDLTKAGQAGTFNLPQDLQGAIDNQAVPSAMRNELGAMESQIQGAYTPYQNLLNQENTRYNTVTQAQDIQSQLQGAQAALTQNPDDATLKQNVADLTAQYQKATSDPNYQVNNFWPQIQQTAQGIQWVPQAAQQYNDLIGKLQADMTGLGGMTLPQFQIRQPNPEAKQASNALATGVGVGAPVAAGASAAGSLSAAQAASAADLAAEMGTTPEAAAALQAEEGGTASLAGTGALTGLQAIGPAALAAYGASNIAQNTLANPVESGLMDLANTGLSLATLSLPPNVISSIGKGINDVINSIGDFFGGLF